MCKGVGPQQFGSNQAIEALQGGRVKIYNASDN